MLSKSFILFGCLLAPWLSLAVKSFAASQLDSVTIGYSSFSGAYGPLWIAVEEQLGRKHGLDIKAIYAGRVRPQQLLASGEVPFVVATGTGALTSHILGVKDQVIVLTFINKVDSALFSRQEIKSTEELRGKTIATGRPGAFADTMVRYVLRAKLGITPDRDVKLLPMGEAALTFPALEKGVVEAASLTLPYTLIAKKMGFRELIDYNKAGVVYPYTTVTMLRQTAAKSPELLERVLKTMIEGSYVYRTNKQRSVAVLKKYMRGAGDDILGETYDHTRPGIEEVPTPSLDVIKSALDILAHQYPQAKQTDPAPIIDASMMRRIEQSGFIKTLYKK
jgi:ABC-type nitrate/sulfonate/bicarbonate transport system substrate-binding protein